MNYLITEGYPLAAERFATEADLDPPSDVDPINRKLELRNSIYAGNIQLAIDLMNEINPSVSI